jgi:peptidoglycan/xylan/chitin deacetylase (PgdA/CDA1 family)
MTPQARAEFALASGPAIAEVEPLMTRLKEQPIGQRLAQEARLREHTPDFAPSDDTRRRFDPLSWAELQRIDPSVVTIGSHTLTHPILPSISDEALEREIVDSRRILEQRLGRTVDLFCYPNGSLDRRVHAVVARTYRAAVTTEYGFVGPEPDPARPAPDPRHAQPAAAGLAHVPSARLMLPDAILVLDADGRVGLACVQSLGALGHRMHTGVRRLGSATERSRWCHRVHAQPPAEPVQAGVEWLTELDRRFGFTLVFATTEASLRWLRAMPEDHPVRIKAGAAVRRIARCRARQGADERHRARARPARPAGVGVAADHRDGAGRGYRRERRAEPGSPTSRAVPTRAC